MFEMETPKQVRKMLTRCWEMAPSSERIIDDVMALPHVLRNIVEAEGCVVADNDLCSGKRYVSVDTTVRQLITAPLFFSFYYILYLFHRYKFSH